MDDEQVDILKQLREREQTSEPASDPNALSDALRVNASVARIMTLLTTELMAEDMTNLQRSRVLTGLHAVIDIFMGLANESVS